jgi:hypothetical protein
VQKVEGESCFDPNANLSNPFGFFPEKNSKNATNTFMAKKYFYDHWPML